MTNVTFEFRWRALAFLALLRGDAMKTLKVTLALSAACVLLGASVAANASSYTVTLEEVGANVVATGSGQIDLTGLTFDSEGYNGAGIIPHIAFIYTGVPGTASGPYIAAYGGTVLGPSSFGSGDVTAASSSSGDPVELSNRSILVPLGYVSDTLLSDGAVYDNATFASLGVTPGTYVWTWGSGADQSFTIEIGATPIPAALPLFVTGLGALGLLGRRRKRRSAAAA